MREREIENKNCLIANRDKTIVSLTQQVAEKDGLIAKLTDKLAIRDASNNNDLDSDDKLNRVLKMLEEIKDEVPEEFRLKLDSVLDVGRRSWSRRSNYQDDWLHVDLDSTVSAEKDVTCEIEESGGLGIPARAFKKTESLILQLGFFFW